MAAFRLAAIRAAHVPYPSTGLPTCALVLKRCKNFDDVLFISAAEHFEKGKRQNVLRDQDIARSVETYRDRREADRYAKRVPLERIEAEGYDLNISRYISTAQAEAEIDLQATHRELLAIEERIRTATLKHNEFLRQLGLPLLPGA